jgi:hypothetical protein
VPEKVTAERTAFVLFWARSRFRNPPSLRKSFPDSTKTNVSRLERFALWANLHLLGYDSSVCCVPPQVFPAFGLKQCAADRIQNELYYFCFMGSLIFCQGVARLSCRENSFRVAKQKFRCIYFKFASTRLLRIMNFFACRTMGKNCA